ASYSHPFSSRTPADHTSGSEHCRVAIIRVPAGHGSSSGFHTHTVDQLYFVLEGEMKLEINESYYTVGPNGLVVIPANVPHRNWNDGPAPEMHLSIIAPDLEDGASRSPTIRP